MPAGSVAPFAIAVFATVGVAALVWGVWRRTGSRGTRRRGGVAGPSRAVAERGVMVGARPAKAGASVEPGGGWSLDLSDDP